MKMLKDYRAMVHEEGSVVREKGKGDQCDVNILI